MCTALSLVLPSSPRGHRTTLYHTLHCTGSQHLPDFLQFSLKFPLTLNLPHFWVPLAIASIPRLPSEVIFQCLFGHLCSCRNCSLWVLILFPYACSCVLQTWMLPKGVPSTPREGTIHPQSPRIAGSPRKVPTTQSTKSARKYTAGLRGSQFCHQAAASPP